MFSIRVIPNSEQHSSPRYLGQITAGELSETFAIGFPSSVASQLDERWKAELRRLVQGSPVVLLIHDPRCAWAIWREGDACYVQQVLRVDGTFSDIDQRKVLSEDGFPISEWEIGIHEIVQFVEA